MVAVHDIRTAAAAEGRQVSNSEEATLAKLEYQQHEKAKAALEDAAERRVISAIVARYWKHANTMIENAAVGVFPY